MNRILLGTYIFKDEDDNDYEYGDNSYLDGLFPSGVNCKDDM